MFTHNTHGKRWVSPPLYKFLLATHIIVSVSWLGVVIAKVVLGLVAVTISDSDLTAALSLSLSVEVTLPQMAAAYWCKPWPNTI